MYKEQRIPFVIEILDERPFCEKCNVNPSTDVHEILTRGRSGGVKGTAWLDKENVLALDRECHTFITDNPKWALENGFVIESCPDAEMHENLLNAATLRNNRS